MAHGMPADPYLGVYIEDTVHASGDKGFFFLAVRNDTASALAGSNGDYIPLTTDSAGRLHVAEKNSGTIANLAKTGATAADPSSAGVFVFAVRNDSASGFMGVDDGDYSPFSVDDGGRVGICDMGGSVTVDNAGTFAVQATIAAGTNAIGKLVANDGVDIGDVTINNASLAVTGTFWQATQPVSAASLPLPTGAATESTLSTLNGKVTACNTGAVTISAALPAGTNAIGKLAANSGVDIGDVDVTSVPTDPFGANADAASATGSISAKLRYIASTGIAVRLSAHGTEAVEALTANGSGTVYSVEGYNTLLIRFATSAFTGTISIIGKAWTSGGSNTVPFLYYNTGTPSGMITSKSLVSDSNDGAILVSCAGWKEMAVNISGYSAGTLTTRTSATTTHAIHHIANAPGNTLDVNLITGQTGIDGGFGTQTAKTVRVAIASDTNQVDTELPAATSMADAKSPASTPIVGAVPYQYNGTTWDLQRGNWETTTGDSGTKTATFNGATQTNYGAVGAYIYVLLGTVSGTSPTMAIKVQFSPDGGTAWMDVGAAATNLTATGNTLGILIGPNNWSQTPGSTPAVLALGTTQDLAINAWLPRTWRLVYTIGGTTPSFALTGVYVSYFRG